MVSPSSYLVSLIPLNLPSHRVTEEGANCSLLGQRKDLLVCAGEA